MTPSVFVDTPCCRSPVACVMLGRCAGTCWPLDRRHTLNDGASVVIWCSTSRSLGPPWPFSLFAVLHRGAAVRIFHCLLPVFLVFNFRFRIVLSYPGDPLWSHTPAAPSVPLPPGGFVTIAHCHPPAFFSASAPPSPAASDRGRAAIKWGASALWSPNCLPHSVPPRP